LIAEAPFEDLEKGEIIKQFALLLEKAVTKYPDQYLWSHRRWKHQKPENILFHIKGDNTSLKLADFGLSTFVNDIPYLYPKCGTPGFVAPEGF
jgi:serine/threonine protein kinase